MISLEELRKVIKKAEKGYKKEMGENATLRHFTSEDFKHIK